MSDSSPEHDFDEFREDFVIYLAARFGVSEGEALRYLGDWMSIFSADALRPLLHPSVVLELDDTRRCRSREDERGGSTKYVR